MKATSGNGYHVSQPGRDIGLAVRIPVPSDDRAISSEGNAVIVSCADINHVGQTWRHIDLAFGTKNLCGDR